MKTNQPLIVIVGETATGKTGLSLQIAKKYNGEVITADSRTIYRGMDIGTAKPSFEEQAGITHYGLDVVSPGEPFTVVDFKKLATEAINEIRSKGKIPILVGGTGLYVDSVIFDYDFSGKVDEAKRSELNNKSLEELVAIAHEMELPVNRDMERNKRHLVRAIERGNVPEVQRSKPLNTIIVGITMNRNVLRKRVEERVEIMFRHGLRKEYNDLKQLYGTGNEAMTGIGYREFADFENGDISMSQVKRNIVKNTLSKLAKNQRTWFKRNPFITWFESPEKTMKYIDQQLDDEYTKT